MSTSSGSPATSGRAARIGLAAALLSAALATGARAEAPTDEQEAADLDVTLAPATTQEVDGWLVIVLRKGGRPDAIDASQVAALAKDAAIENGTRFLQAELVEAVAEGPVRVRTRSADRVQGYRVHVRVRLVGEKHLASGRDYVKVTLPNVPVVARAQGLDALEPPRLVLNVDVPSRGLFGDLWAAMYELKKWQAAIVLLVGLVVFAVGNEMSGPISGLAAVVGVLVSIVAAIRILFIWG
jgi:hypothetical protein